MPIHTTHFVQLLISMQERNHTSGSIKEGRTSLCPTRDLVKLRHLVKKRANAVSEVSSQNNLNIFGVFFFFDNISPRSMCLRHSVCLCGVCKHSLSSQSLRQMMYHPMNRKVGIPSKLKIQAKSVPNNTATSEFVRRIHLFFHGRSHALTNIVYIRGQAAYRPSKLSLQVTSIT